MDEILEKLLKNIQKRFSELAEGSCDQQDFLSHLRSLSCWNQEPMNYPQKEGVEFPPKIHVAHAVCHPECGVEEFIVDGSTQRCQSCGGLLFRGDVREYSISSKEE